MIYTSIIVLFLGLQYHEMSLASGAQTMRLGGAGPVSHLHGGATPTGCFSVTLLPHEAKVLVQGSWFRGSRFKDSSFIFHPFPHPSSFIIVASLLQLHTFPALLSVTDCDFAFMI